MHSGDLSELSTVNLSDVEREALLQVMQRAKVGGMYDHMSCVSLLRDVIILRIVVGVA